MAMLKNVSLFWVKLDPKRPEAAFGDGGPKWQVQIRTYDKAQRDEWHALNIKTKPQEDDGKIVYVGHLRKPTHKKDGEANAPVKVVNGQLEDLDPNTVGNGSVANCRIYQYDYEVKKKEGAGVLKGVATMLMAVQVTKLKVYEQKPREDDFDPTETEIVKPDAEQANEVMSDF